jgi:tetratricopeptide (TPR) repeat protein
MGLSTVCSYTFEYEEANKFMDRARELTANFKKSDQTNFEFLRFVSGNFTEISTILKNKNIKKTDRRYLSELGSAYYRLQKWDEAITICEMAINLDNRDLRAFAILSHAFRESG